MVLKGVPVTVLLCLSLLGNRALADDKALSLKHFKTGISYIKVDDYESAVGAFEKSMSLYPNKGALFNLANSYKALFRYQEAVDAFKRLKVEFGATLKKEMQEAIERNEQEIRNVTGGLEIRVDKDNADVTLDDKAVGKSPLKNSLILSPGEYKLSVVLNGYKPLERTVAVTAGKDHVEHFALGQEELTAHPALSEADDQSAVEDDPSALTEDKPSPLKPILWSGAGATIATGFVAGVFWGLAASSYTDFKKHNAIIAEATPAGVANMSPEDKNDTTNNRDKAAENVKKYSGVALGFSIGAGALAAATAVVLGVTLSRKNKTETPPVTIGPGRVEVSF